MNNFIAVLKNKGKILREQDGVVHIPFGSEYDILLKNKNTSRAVASVEIDGKDVLSGNSILINPNSSVTLLGFMEGNRVKNRFKFIQKTKEIVEVMGDNEDDGLIRIEFRFEKKMDYNTHYYYYKPLDITYDPYWCKPLGPCWSGNNFYTDSHTLYRQFDSPMSGNSTLINSCNISTCNSINETYNKPNVDEGITVKGSKTNQDFTPTYVSNLEDYSDVIILRLKGFNSNGNKVVKPITTKSKLVCKTCGRRSSSGAKFCYNCGTILV